MYVVIYWNIQFFLSFHINLHRFEEAGNNEIEFYEVGIQNIYV